MAAVYYRLWINGIRYIVSACGVVQGARAISDFPCDVVPSLAAKTPEGITKKGPADDSGDSAVSNAMRCLEKAGKKQMKMARFSKELESEESERGQILFRV